MHLFNYFVYFCAITSKRSFAASTSAFATSTSACNCSILTFKASTSTAIASTFCSNAEVEQPANTVKVNAEITAKDKLALFNHCIDTKVETF